MKKLSAILGMKICDFGLWVLSLGPKDVNDRQLERRLILHWQDFRRDYRGVKVINQSGETQKDEK